MSAFDRLRNAADRLGDSAREAFTTASAVAEAGAQHVDDFADAAVEYAHSPQGEKIAGHLKSVGVAAVPFLPAEILLSAAGVAAIIRLADKRGLLESEAAAPLKEIAQIIEQKAPLDENLVLRAVPRLLKLGIIDQLFGSKAKAVRSAGEVAGSVGAIRNMIHKFRDAKAQMEGMEAEAAGSEAPEPGTGGESAPKKPGRGRPQQQGPDSVA